MRYCRVNRLLKRLIVLCFVIWVLYAVYELTFIETRDTLENLAQKSHTLNPHDVDAEELLLDKAHASQQSHSASILFKPADSQNEIHKEQLEVQVASFNINKHEREPKTENKPENSTRMADFARIGGILIAKKQEDIFANVTLPYFNNKQDGTGPGELGYPVIINVTELSPEEKIKYDKGLASNSFNQYASDLMSIHRSLPDGRSQACKIQAEGYNLQENAISVVIIFHNEAWSVLLRSVHSILSRTPEHILREIFLVDDYSNNDDLKKPLEKYFNSFPKVQIIRATKRQGLTRARLLGYYLTTSPIVVFLDSHIECFPGWAEPLIARINEDPTRVVYPMIEQIRDTDLHVNITLPGQFGVFSLRTLLFMWRLVPAVEARRRKADDPIRSPTMPGGLFAISREFFDRIGTYDPGLEFWGAENMELSFKAWMCGGSIELVPCSHIGHIFRLKNPTKWIRDIGNKNIIRVAEVWMDDYKHYLYESLLYKLEDYGDVSERKQLRENLKCKSFDWYMHNVYPEPLPLVNITYAGEIRIVASSMCLDSMGGHMEHKYEPKMFPCHGVGYNQFWYFNEAGQIFQDESYIWYRNGRIVLDNYYTPRGPNWKYRKDQTILHIPTQRCLTASETTDDLILANCSDISNQKWDLQPRRLDVNFPL